MIEVHDGNKWFWNMLKQTNITQKNIPKLQVRSNPIKCCTCVEREFIAIDFGSLIIWAEKLLCSCITGMRV